ncbi:SdrD B-like domain-containing protein, partial [Pannus brasiliensis CCIBt3594]
ATLGDRVWLDTNGNGIQDSGESGIAGVSVQLLGSDGTSLISTTTTGADGSYLFSNLTPGTYYVRFIQPDGYAGFSPANVTDDLQDSDANVAGLTGPIALTSGQSNTSVDAGLYQYATLGDRVWLDTNGNGIQDAGESGIAGVSVQLLGSDGTSLISTTTTGADGSYLFSNLTPGTYYVRFIQPDGYAGFSPANVTDDLQDSDANATGLTGPIALTSGQFDTSVDAGLYQYATIGDRVWLDGNENGIQDTGEPGVGGMIVRLLDGNGNPVLDSNGNPIETVTRYDDPLTQDADETGLYEFTVRPGTYSVQFDLSSVVGVSGFTAIDAGSDDGLDSDVDANTGRVASFTVTGGQSNLSIDAGLLPEQQVLSGEIGDRVWSDANANGIQDAGEEGIEGVSVELLDSNSGTFLAGTTTGIDGFYLFSGLSAGTYRVRFILPEGGYSGFSPADATDDLQDSDANALGMTGAIELGAGESNWNVDAGVIARVSIGNFVWQDTNKNGLQDSGEPGVAGATVNLLDASGNPVLDASGSPISTVSDAFGYYSFEVAPGTYSIGFVAPGNYTFAGKDAGTNDSIDSDADPFTGRTAPVSVASANDFSLDAGLILRPDGRGEGLTPGFWKNNGIRQNHYPVPYTPDSNYETVFGVDVNDALVRSLGNKDNTLTFLEALNADGNTVSQALLRHSTAGILNAAHPSIDYFYSVNEVIGYTRQAFAGTLNANTVKDWFAYRNEAGAVF